jgi:hypothetical protein
MRALLVAVAGALATLVLWQGVSGPDRTSGLVTTAPPRAETHASAPAWSVGSGYSPASRGPAADGALPRGGVPRPDHSALPAHVARAIERTLDRHAGAAGPAAHLGPADRAALRDALVALRRASLRARRRSRDGAWQAEQSRALVDADRLFRDKLGVGLAEFVADAGPPGRVEDLGRQPAS